MKAKENNCFLRKPVRPRAPASCYPPFWKVLFQVHRNHCWTRKKTPSATKNLPTNGAGNPAGKQWKQRPSTHTHKEKSGHPCQSEPERKNLFIHFLESAAQSQFRKIEFSKFISPTVWSIKRYWNMGFPTDHKTNLKWQEKTKKNIKD